MSRSRDVSDLKLCLEILSRFDIYPDVTQLECFLADKSKRELLNDCTVQIMQAWTEKMGDCLMSACPLKDMQPYVNPNTVDEHPIAVNLEKHSSAPELPVAELPDFENQESLTEPAAETESVRYQQQSNIRFKLPNATVGKTYHGQLECSDAARITTLGISGLEELGLSYDLAANTLSGEPEKAGEHTLIIRYQHNNAAPQTKELSFVINSNPKNLWKDIPSDKNTVFWKPDSDFQGEMSRDGWKVVASSKRGRSHAHIGSCRDDDFAMKVDKESFWQIVAVADGAGSCEFSREGARIIAHNSVDVLAAQLQQADANLTRLIERWLLDKNLDNEIALQQALVEVFAAALRSSIETITALAKRQQVAYRDFYSTLLLAAHKSFPDSEFTVSYWIGDGGLGMYCAETRIRLLGDNDSGEYAGQTRFLDESALEKDDLFKRVRFCGQKNFSALILMTDGITDPLFETDNNLRALSYWDELWQQIQPQLDKDNPQLSAERLTEWLDFWSPGNHDDRTIALIYR